MREDEFDKILKNKIDEQIKAPEKLKNRITQEIQGFDNKSKKTPLIKAMQGIAAVVVVGVLSVTSYAAVTGNLNLENMGFFKASKNYSQNAVEVNQSIENEYLKYTLNNIACDDTYLITESTLILTDIAIEQYGDIEYNNEYKKYLYPIESTTYVNNKEFYYWGIDIQKIADKEYKIFKLYNISDIKDKNLHLELNIKDITLKNPNDTNLVDGSLSSEMSDDLFTPINTIDINKSISMDIQRNESSNSGFKEISQSVESKTIVVKEAANTNFDTIIKASIITEENYTNYLENSENDLDYNDFMVTQGNNDDISYQTSEDPNTYFILDDGNMILENDLSQYVAEQNNQEDYFTSIINSEFSKDPDTMDYSQIIEKYGTNANLESKIAKVQKNYTIKIGNQENGKDVETIKLLPVKKTYIDDRTNEEYEYYKNAKWYKLENKSYTATSELGGTLKITSIDITDDAITFNYNTKGLIGENLLILMRQNNGEFNYFLPDKTEIKGLNSNENKMTFKRKNNFAIGSFSQNISVKDTTDLLNNISKDEFTMLFGKKNGTKFIGNGLVFNVPNKITNKITIKNIEINDLENTSFNDNNYNDTDDNGLFEPISNDDNLFNQIQTENTTNEDDSAETESEPLTQEEYNALFNKTKRKLENIKSNGSKMDKNTASISGIKIGSTINQVHSIMNETPQNTFKDETTYIEYYSDDILVSYKNENNAYYVNSISTRGRLKSNTNIKVGDTLQKVLESYTKNDKLTRIYTNSYNDGWVLYGNDNAFDLKNVEGYIINSAGGKNAYFLLNSYSDDYIEQDYNRISLIYFDDDVGIEYFVEDGTVSEIILSVHEDMPEY